MLDTWHKRVGAILLLLREQEKGWDRTMAAQEAKVDPKTIKRIEHGSETVSGAKLGQYARVFGLTINELSERARHLEGPIAQAREDKSREVPVALSTDILETVRLWFRQLSAEDQEKVREALPSELLGREARETRVSPRAPTRSRRRARGA